MTDNVCPGCLSRNRATRFYVTVPGLVDRILCRNHWHETEDDEERIVRALKKIFEELEKILRVERDIRALITPSLKSGVLNIMPKTVNVGETATGVITGLDQNGQAFPLDATFQVAYSASNPANVSFGTPNPDGSDTVTAVAPDTGDVISAVITRPDGQTVTTTSDTLVISAPAPVLTSATLTLQ